MSMYFVGLTLKPLDVEKANEHDDHRKQHAYFRLG